MRSSLAENCVRSLSDAALPSLTASGHISEFSDFISPNKNSLEFGNASYTDTISAKKKSAFLFCSHLAKRLLKAHFLAPF